MVGGKSVVLGVGDGQHWGVELPAFVVSVVLIWCAPGPALTLVLRRAALRGFRATLPVVLGLEVGLYLWALLAAAGVAALVATSEVAYLVLRVVGAIVLMVLGFRALRSAWRQRRGSEQAIEPVDPTPERAGRRGGWWAFGEGLLVQLANPKAAVFMVAFYPQFIRADQPLFTTTALLAFLQIVLETVLYIGLTLGVARAGGWFRRPAIRRRLDALSGTVLVGLGLRVAVVAR